MREEQNTSYRWLAQIMGVSETTVSSMRRANTEPRATEAVKIASALGTTVEFLVKSNESENDSPMAEIYLKKYIALKKELEHIVKNL